MKRQNLYILVVLSIVLASCTSPTTWFALGTVQPIRATDSGFRPEHDGFTFANYGAEAGTNLEAADIHRMFGDVVCTAPGPACTLTPTAQIWMNEMNRAMANGHCEGMAVLSQYFYYGILQPQTFGAATADALVLDKNIPLQREIAYWWATQATFPTRAYRVVTDPRDVVQRLQQGLTIDADVAALYTIGLYEPNYTGGHTVTPIALRTVDDHTVAIQIYDNNTPNQTPEILVDTVRNEWHYEATRPDGSVVSYIGDANSQTMDLTATAPRLEQQECPFCNTNPLLRSVSHLTTILFSSTKTALKGNTNGYSAYFVDAQGRRVGVIRGVVYNEIPKAQVNFLRGAPDQWSAQGMPVLTIPAEVQGSLRLTGATDVPVNITAFGAGSVVGVHNMQLDEVVASDIRLDQQTGTVALASATTANPEIVVASTRDAKRIALNVSNIHLEAGDKAAVTTDAGGETVSVATSGSQPVAVSSSIDRADGTDPIQAERTVPSRDVTDAPILDDVAPAPIDENQPPPIIVPTEEPPPSPTPRVTRTPRPTREGDDDTAAADTEVPLPTATRRANDDGRRSPTRTATSADPDSHVVITTEPTETTKPEDISKQSPTRTATAGLKPTHGSEDDDEADGKEPTVTAANGKEPSRTPRPTRWGEKTPRPEATERPESTRESEPTRVPESTRVPEPTRRIDATRKPEPTDKPEPTERREPTERMEPTRKREPTEKPEPTERIEPTERREATRTPRRTEKPEPTKKKRDDFAP